MRPHLHIPIACASNGTSNQAFEDHFSGKGNNWRFSAKADGLEFHGKACLKFCITNSTIKGDIRKSLHASFELTQGVKEKNGTKWTCRCYKDASRKTKSQTLMASMVGDIKCERIQLGNNSIYKMVKGIVFITLVG